MELPRLRQLASLIVGLACAAGATILIAQSFAVEAVIVILVVAALILLTCAIMGVTPNVTYKDVSVGWAKVVPVGGYLPKDEFEERRKIIEDERTRLRTDLEKVDRRLEDYILAHGPAPDNGMTDEERLPALYRASQELEQEMDRRSTNGADHDDGLDAEHFRKLHVKAYDALVKEERRQWAQFTFGLRATQPKSIYDD
jgi:hypothetical protein